MVYSLSLLHNSYFFINLECHFTPVLTPKIYMLVALVVNNPPANAGDTRDMVSIPGLGRSLGVGNGTLFQYFCQENAMGRGA